MTGSGTQGDPFVIWDVNDLQAVQNDLDAYYELGNDIDASATSGWNGGLGFDPIGTSWDIDPFNGHFDGKEFTISNLYINRPTENFVGLFAACYYTGIGGEINNVNLINANITGNKEVGALIGRSYSPVVNCNSTGIIRGGGGITGAYNIDIGGLIGYQYANTTRCNSSCSVTTLAMGEGIGGFLGYNNGEVHECFTIGNVIADYTNDYVGGFIGENDNQIFDSYARGNVIGHDYVGGFVGLNSGNIDNSYSTGEVSGSTNVSGFCGDNIGTITNDCFWDIETSGTEISNGGIGKTTAQMKMQTTFSSWDFASIWAINAICNNGYPCLLEVTPNCVLMTDSPRIIHPIKDIVTLEALRNIEMSAVGRLYVNEEGKFVYESRYGRNP